MGSSQILRASFRTYVPHGSSMIARATFAQSSAYAGNVTDVANMMSDRATPRQRASERDFVGIFKVATDRQAARQSRDFNVGLRKQLRQEAGGRFAFHIRVEREDHFGDFAVFEPFDKFGDVEVAGLHVGHRVDDAAEHVVQAAVFARALDAHHVFRLFDHADHAVVATRIGADRAWAGFAHVAANVTESYFLFDFGDGVDQPL